MEERGGTTRSSIKRGASYVWLRGVGGEVDGVGAHLEPAAVVMHHKATAHERPARCSLHPVSLFIYLSNTILIYFLSQFYSY
jgi:hypothetical protein